MALTNEDLMRIWNREKTSSKFTTTVEGTNEGTNGLSFSDGGTGGTQTYSWTTWNTPQVEAKIEIRKELLGIHPNLYFKYAKSKLNPIESHRLKQRMKQLEKMVDEYARLGQDALSEGCIKQYMIVSRESVMLACGITKFLTEEHVEKFRYKLRGTSLHITPLRNFARPLPKRVAEKVQKCMEKKLFDDYVIFHLDNREVQETEKEKKERKERDPIIFGRVQYSERYYFIADWIDELDDLRLDIILKKLSLKKEKITLKNKVIKKDMEDALIKEEKK